jgi:hypothetical protein
MECSLQRLNCTCKIPDPKVLDKDQPWINFFRDSEPLIVQRTHY